MYGTVISCVTSTYMVCSVVFQQDISNKYLVSMSHAIHFLFKILVVTSLLSRPIRLYSEILRIFD